MASIKDWSSSLIVTSPNRLVNWMFPSGNQWTRFYFDIPELRFAGRDGVTVLGLDLYGDGTVRVVVANTDADKTPSYHLDSALIQTKVDGDHVFGSTVVLPNRTGDEPQTYTVDGTIDRTLLTFVGEITVTTPSGGTRRFMTLTPQAPARGCVQFPVLD